MPAQNDFASRVARIEARASGKRPKTPVIAPFVGEDVKSMERLMRPRRNGLGRVVVAVAGLALVGTIFADDLAPMLPSGMQPHARALSAAFDETLADTLGRVAQSVPPDEPAASVN